MAACKVPGGGAGTFACQPARNRRRSDERGFALLLVFLMASMIALSLYMELPRAAMQAQRDKEETLIDRGEQYKRAIQLFVNKARRYPGTIEELENFQRQRFLRHRYDDPLTGKSEWRLIHVQGGVLTDSKVTKPNTGKDATSTTSTPNGFVGEQAGLAGTQNQTQTNLNVARDRRRPSENANATMPGMTPPNGDPANDPNAVPGQTPDNGQTPVLNGEPNPNGPTLQGQNGQQPVYPGQPNSGQPGFPGQTGFPGQQGQPGMPGIPGVPGVNSAMPPGSGAMLPGAAANSGNSFVGGGGSFVGGGTSSGGGSQPTIPGQPGQPVPQYPGQPVPQYPGQPGNIQNMGMPGNPQGFPQPGNTPGQPNPAADMIRNILTTPRPGGMPQPGGLGGQSFGGGIAGVASNGEGEGVKIYNDRSLYQEWEFIYDPRKQKQIPNPNGGGLGGTPAGAMGSNTPQQPGAPGMAPPPGTTPIGGPARPPGQ